MPNNGTRIYTENGKGIDPRADVYKVLGITRRRNGYDLGYACTNTHGKINPMAKRKPYAFGSRYGYTDEDAKKNNWGMKPVPVKLDISRDGRVLAPEWGQWNAPVAWKNWSRIADFNGYTKDAQPWISNVRVYTNNPHNSYRPMGGQYNGTGRGYIYGEFEINNQSNYEEGGLPMNLFRHPNDAYLIYPPYPDFGDWCVTLIWGCHEGSEFGGPLWAVQTEPVKYMTRGTYRLEIPITYAMYKSITAEGEGEDYPFNVAVLCLAPPMEEIMGEDGDPVGDPYSLNVNDSQRLISLNMWDDDDIRQESGFVADGIDEFMKPSKPDKEVYLTCVFEGNSDPGFPSYSAYEAVFYFDPGSPTIYVPDYPGEKGGIKVDLYYNIHVIDRDGRNVWPEPVFLCTGQNGSSITGANPKYFNFPSDELGEMTVDASDLQEAVDNGAIYEGEYTVKATYSGYGTFEVFLPDGTFVRYIISFESDLSEMDGRKLILKKRNI